MVSQGLVKTTPFLQQPWREIVLTLLTLVTGFNAFLLNSATIPSTALNAKMLFWRLCCAKTNQRLDANPGIFIQSNKCGSWQRFYFVPVYTNPIDFIFVTFSRLLWYYVGKCDINVWKSNTDISCVTHHQRWTFRSLYTPCINQGTISYWHSKAQWRSCTCRQSEQRS